MIAFVDFKRIELTEFKKKKKKRKEKLKLFAPLCALMYGKNANYCVMDGVVEKFAMAPNYLKCAFCPFFPSIAKMFAKAVYIYIYIYCSRTACQFRLRSTWVAILAK